MQLEAKNISFRYNKNSPELFNDFSISINSGEKIALFAPSGYGKTTLALLLAGYLSPDKGEILLDGNKHPSSGICPVQLIHQHPEKAINPRWKLKRVLEESGQFDDEQLKNFGIEKAWLERYPRELSGGELQRFCIARALLARPAFLICDEISTMLDVITQAQLWSLILETAEKTGMGLISITHNLHLAKYVSDKIYDLQTNQYI